MSGNNRTDFDLGQGAAIDTNKAKTIISIAALCVVALGCQGKMNAVSGEHPAALVVYPNAKDIHYLTHEGTDQLTYRVSAKFPASGVIGWVAFKMQEMGWQPLVKDFLNPNVQSSHVTGWTKFFDGTTKPELVVHQWLGDWQNDAGDIVRNQFRYSYPKDGTPNLVEMEVLEIYIPASLVKQTLDSIRKSEEEKSRAPR